jgi:AraC-like DNA-binding protein
MAEVALAAGITPAEIRRSVLRLRRLLGPVGLCSSFRDALTYSCLQHAADLIASGVKIEAAFRLSGFRSKSNFIGQFREFFGCLPREHAKCSPSSERRAGN